MRGTNMITDSWILKEVGTLLYWSMLAACSVGPGTVVVCARAGAEYGLSLSWSLLVASFMAYIMLEASARLTINSGMSLGECLRHKYSSSPSLLGTPLLCWAVTTCICLGNMFYELNTFAGGLDAVLALPGVSNLEGNSAIILRVGTCLAYALVVMALLWQDRTEALGVFLGIVMCGMVGLFLVVVVKMDLLSVKGVALGMIPSIPAKREEGAEPADLVISLVSTTAVGFNLFLGGSMASGRDLRAAQRGIAFSCFAAFVVSELILMVGAGHFIQTTQDTSNPSLRLTDMSQGGSSSSFKFTIPVLRDFVKEFTGEIGVVVFAVGFIAAALSSQLATPLGATATAQSMFFLPEDRARLEVEEGKGEVADMGWHGTERGRLRRVRVMKQSINFVMVGVAAVVISTNVDRMMIILIAQVFNGCLLPIFSLCLLLCVNDRSIMSGSPQKGWANCFLLLTVLFTLFLASNVIVQKVLTSVLVEVWQRQLLSLGVAIGGMVAVSFCTSLGMDILASFKSPSAPLSSPLPPSSPLSSPLPPSSPLSSPVHSKLQDKLST